MVPEYLPLKISHGVSKKDHSIILISHLKEDQHLVQPLLFLISHISTLLILVIIYYIFNFDDNINKLLVPRDKIPKESQVMNDNQCDHNKAHAQ